MFESDEDRRKFDKLCESVEDINNKVNAMDVLLRGKDDDPEPSGLIHNVHENTKHRKNSTWFIKLLTTVTTGLVITELLKLM